MTKCSDPRCDDSNMSSRRNSRSHRHTPTGGRTTARGRSPGFRVYALRSPSQGQSLSGNSSGRSPVTVAGAAAVSNRGKRERSFREARNAHALRSRSGRIFATLSALHLRTTSPGGGTIRRIFQGVTQNARKSQWMRGSSGSDRAACVRFLPKDGRLRPRHAQSRSAKVALPSWTVRQGER
jgi:hypothetical protein